MRNRMQKVVCFMLLASLLVVSLQCKEQTKKIPVYYVGSNEIVAHVQTLALRTTPVTAFEKIPEKHILIVDGNANVPKEFLLDEILSGIPIIVLQNTGIAKNLLEGHPTPSVVDGRTPDGMVMGETAFGCMAYPVGNILHVKFFLSCIEDFREAAKFGYLWAAEYISEEAGDVQVLADAYWGYIYQLDWSSGDDWKPYGRQNVRSLYYKLYNDNSSTYDWYDIRCRHQSVPGISKGWSGSWCTADMYTWIDADYYRSHYFLSDYGPTTTSGQTTVGVTVGVSAGEKGASVSASLSWSYSVPDVFIYDQSDFYEELAKWWHDVDEGKAVGENTYMCEPGACIRVSNGDPMGWREHYGTKYCHKVWFLWWWWWECTTEGWVEIGWNPI